MQQRSAISSTHPIGCDGCQKRIVCSLAKSLCTWSTGRPIRPGLPAHDEEKLSNSKNHIRLAHTWIAQGPGLSFFLPAKPAKRKKDLVRLTMWLPAGLHYAKRPSVTRIMRRTCDAVRDAANAAKPRGCHVATREFAPLLKSTGEVAFLWLWPWVVGRSRASARGSAVLLHTWVGPSGGGGHSRRR
ncbi:hypothetical protein BKA81DRAFT_93454 [Phyllosticta paracitricarpa]